MRCVTDPDLRVFAARSLPWLSREPVRHNLLASLVQRRLEDGPGSEPGAIWLRVLDDCDTLAAVAVRTPAHPLLLSTMSAPAAQATADHLAGVQAGDVSQRLPGVHGPADASLAFMARYQERTGARSLPGLSTRLYRLDRAVPPAGVSGHLRPATAADRAVIVRWLTDFASEDSPGQQVSDPTPAVDDRLSRGGMLWLWEDASAPASFLSLSPPVRDVVRISSVYTPPRRRGNGYASACVAAVGQRLLDGGASACMLYADTTNPTSNRMYARIGFQPVDETQDWVFSYW